MPTKITWTMGVQVTGGPSFALSGSTNVDAYEVINVSLPPKAALPAGVTETKITVQPAGSTLSFLMMQAGSYDPANKLTYTVDAVTDKHSVDAPQLLVGSGAADLLDKALQTLSFTHDSTNPILLTLVVGRDATPALP